MGGIRAVPDMDVAQSGIPCLRGLARRAQSGARARTTRPHRGAGSLRSLHLDRDGAAILGSHRSRCGPDRTGALWLFDSVAEGSSGLWSRSPDACLSLMRARSRPDAPGPCRQACGVRPTGRGACLRRAGERARHGRERGLLPGHVLWVARILEPARPPYVRHSEPVARIPRSQFEGGGLRAQLTRRRCLGDRDVGPRRGQRWPTLQASIRRRRIHRRFRDRPRHGCGGFLLGWADGDQAGPPIARGQLREPMPRHRRECVSAASGEACPRPATQGAVSVADRASDRGDLSARNRARQPLFPRDPAPSVRRVRLVRPNEGRSTDRDARAQRRARDLSLRTLGSAMVERHDRVGEQHRVDDTLGRLERMREARIWPNGARYLWTDAFGLVLLVSLHHVTEDARFLEQARWLVAEVERVLGRKRGIRIGEAADRDGQYFHYLAMWLFALGRLGHFEPEYRKRAIALVHEIHRPFMRPGVGVVWKMKEDLSGPYPGSGLGALDAFDGYVAS